MDIVLTSNAVIMILVTAMLFRAGWDFLPNLEIVFTALFEWLYGKIRHSTPKEQ